jgi:hypothetical protein
MPNRSIYQSRVYSPSLDVLMREVLHTLGNIDFQNELELDRVEKSVTDEELKQYIRDTIRAAYRQRRQPYVELLKSLRLQQHRQSLAA